MRDGADHLITIPYEDVSFGNVSDESGSGRNERRMGHDTRFFVPTHNGRGKESTSERVVVSNSTTNDRLVQAALSTAARENQDFSMLSFRSGEAVSRACAGEDVSTIMQKKPFWKSPKTAWRYMRLAGVLSLGTTRHTKVPGITDEQYTLINEFPLKEHSKSWAAFGNAPMVE